MIFNFSVTKIKIKIIKWLLKYLENVEESGLRGFFFVHSKGWQGPLPISLANNNNNNIFSYTHTLTHTTITSISWVQEEVDLASKKPTFKWNIYTTKTWKGDILHKNWIKYNNLAKKRKKFFIATISFPSISIEQKSLEMKFNEPHPITCFEYFYFFLAMDCMTLRLLVNKSFIFFFCLLALYMYISLPLCTQFFFLYYYHGLFIFFLQNVKERFSDTGLGGLKIYIQIRCEKRERERDRGWLSEALKKLCTPQEELKETKQ